MKNYYDILGLSSYEDSQDAILSSYKNGTAKLRAEVLDNNGIEIQLIDFNEAFLVLSDRELKQQYDYCLSSNTETKALKDAISAKRQRAEDFIHGKLANAPKKRKKKVWPAILCGFFLLSALGTIMKTCTQTMVKSSGAPYEKVGNYQPNENWTNYEIANAFTISVPNTMELRNDNDEYTLILQNNGYSINNADAVFQQADLSNLSNKAYETYCRILVGHYKFSPGELEHHNETSYIDAESLSNFREVVDAEIEPWTYVESPTFQWIDINGVKAMEAKYKRNGDKGPVVCRLYLLPNYDEMVKMIVSYRESDANIWKSDLENIIKTFRWNNPK